MTRTLRLRPPMMTADEAGMDRGPLLAEAALSALHSLHDAFSLKVAFSGGKVSLFASAADPTLAVIRQQLYAQYPEAEIDPVDTEEPGSCLTRDLILEKPDLLPIKTYPHFLDQASRRLVDPLAGIVAALDNEPAASVEIRLTPAHHIRRRAHRALPVLDQRLAHRFHGYGRFLTRLRLLAGWKRWVLAPLTLLLCAKKAQEEHPDANDKIEQPLFHASLRLTVAGTGVPAIVKMHELTAAFQAFAHPANEFTALPIREGKKSRRPTFLLSAEEVATLWHVPGPLTRASNFDWLASRKLEIPVNLPEGEVTIGEAVFRSQSRRFGILCDDRRRHLYAIGKTGSGKSTLLLNLICADIAAGRGIVVIDPHGDLVDAALQSLPKGRMNDLIYFDPSDYDYPLSFNVLQCPPHQRQLAVSGVVSVFKRMWPGLWSGRQEYIIRNCLLALLETENETLLGVPRLFVDEPYRRRIVAQTKDISVRTFWSEYDGWTERYRAEAIAPVQNKVGQLLSIPVLRHILGQPALKLDLRHALDTRKVLLVNLSKGKLGEDVSSFLGSLLVTRIQLAGMSRADIPEKERVDCQVYVDEFQNYCTESFATLLSEARKFRISLCLAHQFLGQLVMQDGSTAIRDAVFGNAGSLLCFTLGPDDAQVMSTQFESLVPPQDIISLPRYEAYMKLLVRGTATKPFSFRSLPPPEVPHDKQRIEVARRLSRTRYAEKREKVEAGIHRWLGETTRKKPLSPSPRKR